MPRLIQVFDETPRTCRTDECRLGADRWPVEIAGASLVGGPGMKRIEPRLLTPYESEVLLGG